MRMTWFGFMVLAFLVAACGGGDDSEQPDVSVTTVGDGDSTGQPSETTPLSNGGNDGQSPDSAAEPEP